MGEGGERPIFRWSNAISSSAVLVISYTFALAPLQTVCKVYFAINLLRYSIQRAFDIISSIARGEGEGATIYGLFFSNFLSKVKLVVARTFIPRLNPKK